MIHIAIYFPFTNLLPENYHQNSFHPFPVLTLKLYDDKFHRKTPMTDKQRTETEVSIIDPFC